MMLLILTIGTDDYTVSTLSFSYVLDDRLTASAFVSKTNHPGNLGEVKFIHGLKASI
tara:strand:+ start:783 stop:953 length:171 start_codon:yes stop_codon:yes gene_type:complete